MDQKANGIMTDKAVQAQRCYELLRKQMGFETNNTLTFVARPERQNQFMADCFRNNFMPVYSELLTAQRLPAIRRLFQPEEVLQTGPIAAVLAAVASAAADIGKIRGIIPEKAQRIDCDIAFAGAQSIRVYMVDCHSQRFSQFRLRSMVLSVNALTGVMFKYPTKDGRFVSFHTYNRAEKEALLKALHYPGDVTHVSMLTLQKDRKWLTKLTAQREAQDLEDLAFACGASGCVIHTREEWEKLPVGQAVKKMPVVRIQQMTDGEPWKPSVDPERKGPLSGIKVLDLTHIIAGAACSRLLAEYGADVLMVRNGTLLTHEDSGVELDGWAGKRVLNLDLNQDEAVRRCKELVKQADIITYSYQDDAFRRFGLDREAIMRLNPNVIYAHEICFSDSVWHERPGWAPLAEDITGLSYRNGKGERIHNLFGVPLDYIPGLLLALATFETIKRKLLGGGGYLVTGSLTRGAQWLHECTDLCQAPLTETLTTGISGTEDHAMWRNGWQLAETSLGEVGFPTIPTACEFTDSADRILSFREESTAWNC